MANKILRRICIATNFEAESDAALATAASLARTYEAHVDLLTVVQPPPFYAKVLSPIQSRLEDTDAVVERVRQRLEEMAHQPPLAHLPVVAQVRVGSAFAEIIAHARQQQDELVVVGTRSRGGLEGLLLGNTAERVLRKCPVPVLVARKTLPPRPEVIVAPVDFSPAGRPAIDQAVDLARQWGARLILIHAIEPAAEVYGWGAELAGGEVYLLDPEALDPEWKALLETLDLANVRWEQQTRRGYAVQALCEVADAEHADLIVIGTHGRSALPHALLGSVAEGVSRAASCNVLTVRPDAYTFHLP
jgi:nucleotide-binding universal stress UspA family protein